MNFPRQEIKYKKNKIKQLGTCGAVTHVGRLHRSDNCGSGVEFTPVGFGTEAAQV